MINAKASIVLGLSLTASISMVLLYFLRKKLEENEEFFALNKSTQIKMKVPRDAVGAVVGREGATIKSIEAQTNTKIRFSNDDRGEEELLPERVMFIKGAPEAVLEAENLVSQIIQDQPKVLTEEIVVPARACGRIIGRNGDNIRAMCRQSRARISVERRSPEFRDPDHPVKVTLRGTPDQIEAAVGLISIKLAEEENHRTRGPLSIDGPLPPTSQQAPSNRAEEVLESGSPVLTYVSAVRSPHCFWLQLVSPASTALDKMIENMTAFYSSPESASPLALSSSPAVGELVAAPFPADSCWYRASVRGLSTDDYSGKTRVRVHYVDFGDEEELPVESVYQLQPQYLSLLPQAVACSLAHVRPAQKADQWSDEACERFCQLAHASQWRAVVACRLPGALVEGRHLVELVDTSVVEGDVHIDQVLVEEGLADWDTTIQ